MISVAQLREKAKRKYWHVLKDLLKSEIQGDTKDQSIFPLIIAADKQLPGDFNAMRLAIEELVENSFEKKGSGYRLTFEEHKTRRYGIQSIPACISFDSGSDYFSFIRKHDESKKILTSANQLRTSLPQLNPWIENNPQKICKYLGEWDEIIKVLNYFVRFPRPAMYIRELPVDVHTKFIETHTAILRELLEVLIPNHMDREGSKFEEQFHIKTPEPMIRLRNLDNSMHEQLFTFADDLAIPSRSFNRLNLNCDCVIITENLMTYLTLPPKKRTIAIFGGGFQVEILKEAPWLQGKTVFYWGDIDAHGFRILSNVRRFLPGTISLMMDEKTFERFALFAGDGAGSQIPVETGLNLDPQELFLYRHVTANNLRLEQERIPQNYVTAKIESI